jgi:hypothetical protein
MGKLLCTRTIGVRTAYRTDHGVARATRWAALAMLAATATAHAERDEARLPRRSIGLAFDACEADLGAASASAFGAVASIAGGGARMQGFIDGAFGGLYGDSSAGRLGRYVRLDTGVRFLATTLDLGGAGMDLTLEIGSGAESYALRGGPDVTRPFVFAGWGVQVRTHVDRHGMILSYYLRLATSPRLENAEAVRIICRGDCPVADTGRTDLTLMGMLGVSVW